MKEVTKIDVYGNCGTLLLSRGSEQETVSQYKFYLAFENAKCPSYVTEKLYRVINQDLLKIPPVPVVLGPNKTWYEEHLPKKSFIHVDDFEDPAKLAKYLNFLDKNHDYYMDYLKWRQNYIKVCDGPSKCQLCQKLVKSGFKSEETPSIQDFESFWKRSECQKPVKNSDTESSVFLILQRLYWSLGL